MVGNYWIDHWFTISILLHVSCVRTKWASKSERELIFYFFKIAQDCCSKTHDRFPSSNYFDVQYYPMCSVLVNILDQYICSGWKVCQYTFNNNFFSKYGKILKCLVEQWHICIFKIFITLQKVLNMNEIFWYVI